jgi:hypothetical protein
LELEVEIEEELGLEVEVEVEVEVELELEVEAKEELGLDEAGQHYAGLEEEPGAVGNTKPEEAGPAGAGAVGRWLEEQYADILSKEA